MRLAALYRGDADAGDIRLHVAVDGGFAPVDEVAAGARRPDLAGLRDVGDLYARGADAVADLRAMAARPGHRGPGGIRYAPPVLRPGKIVCVGLNYADHIAESRTAKPDRIVLFAKFPSCLVGHEDPIRYPAITTELDYEGELAVVIGRQARNVPVDSALDYVGGYTSSTTSPPVTCRAPSRSGSGARRWTRSPRSARSCWTRPRRRRWPRCGCAPW